jgi:hypothetical protein
MEKKPWSIAGSDEQMNHGEVEHSEETSNRAKNNLKRNYFVILKGSRVVIYL